jgi:hypothetical protein
MPQLENMAVASPQTARKILFYDGVDDRKHRVFLFLLFSEEHRDFRILRVDRLGDALTQTETAVPEFLDSASTEEQRAFSDFVGMLVSL